MNSDNLRRVLSALLCAALLFGSLAAGSAESYTELRYGMTDSDDVRQMQLRLKELGYLSSGASGGYWDQTKAAVAAFQASAGLPVNGKVASVETLTALFDGASVGESGGSAAPAPVTPAPVVSAEGVTELRYGMENSDAVRRMQDRLRSLGYFSAGSSGGYWSATRQAVEAFQKDAGLPVNGKVASVEMLNKLYGGSASATTPVPETTTPRPDTTTPAPETTTPRPDDTTPAPAEGFAELRANTQSEAVRAMQARLKELGFFSGNATGGYYSVTITAVETFQRAAGLKVNGKVATVEMQEKLFSADAPNSFSMTSDYTTLTYGMNDSDQVRLMQRRLSALGYFSGTATGNYYSTTGRAVANFQTAIGMKSDSKTATPEMLRVLYSNSAPVYGTSYTTPVPTATPTPAPADSTPTPTPEPTATPEPTPAPVLADLSYGTEGSEAVSRMQDRLRELGYFRANSTGGYWSETLKAVQKFQQAIFFEGDGRQATVAMLEILYSDAAPVYGTTLATPTPEPTATPDPSAAATETPAAYEELKYGMTGSGAVSALQTRLKELGFLSCSATGNYYSLTADGVRAFLKYAYMNGDGATATVEMQQLLFASDLEAQVEKRKADLDAAMGEYAGAKTDVCLRTGSKGEQVMYLTKRLVELGYLEGSAIENYTSDVAAAVKWFQNSNGLSADGIAGPQTLSLIYTTGAITASDSMESKPDTTPTETTGTVRRPTISTIRNVDFFSSAGAKYFDRKSGVFRDGATAIVTDIASGISYQVRRRGGYNHADVEPVTAFDTWQMYRVYGQTWAWTRHAVVVTLTDGTSLAASINGMPHGNSSISDNNMDGHTCIHFLNSRTHSTDKVDAAHQAAVATAASTSAGSLQAKVNAQ